MAFCKLLETAISKEINRLKESLNKLKKHVIPILLKKILMHIKK